jgi:hypothetical protein
MRGLKLRNSREMGEVLEDIHERATTCEITHWERDIGEEKRL